MSPACILAEPRKGDKLTPRGNESGEFGANKRKGNVGNVSCINPSMWYFRRHILFCVVALSLFIVAALYPPSQVLDASKSRYCWVPDGLVHYSVVMKASSPKNWCLLVESCNGWMSWR